MPLLLNRGVREMAARFGLPVGLVLAAELLTWARHRPRHPHNTGLAARTGLRDTGRSSIWRNGSYRVHTAGILMVTY